MRSVFLPRLTLDNVFQSRFMPIFVVAHIVVPHIRDLNDCLTSFLV